jgi:hypothetical protein
MRSGERGIERTTNITHSSVQSNDRPSWANHLTRATVTSSSFKMTNVPFASLPASQRVIDEDANAATPKLGKAKKGTV